jgi:hypothetical protein
MIRCWVLWVGLLSLGVCLSAVRPGATLASIATPVAAGTPPTTPSPSVTPVIGGIPNYTSHVVIGVQGQLSVKRTGRKWQAQAPARFGTEVELGDLLSLGQNSEAKVFCADSTIRRMKDNIGGVPCAPPSPTSMVLGPARLSRLRGELECAPDYPQIVAPRRTNILDEHPVLRWLPVDGTSQYRVKVSGDPQRELTPFVTSETKITYPNSFPRLIPGRTYTLMVSAVTVSGEQRASTAETGARLGFTLLAPKETERVRQAEEKIRALHNLHNLKDYQIAFLIARLYASTNLLAEAAQVLEDLAGTAQEPAIFRTLGKLYADVGLLCLARDRYQQVLNLSHKPSDPDLEGQALAQEALGQIYAADGNNDEARKSLQLALDWYKQIGDTFMPPRLQEELDALN